MGESDVQEKWLIGVNLLSGSGSLQTNLGVVLLDQGENISVSDLRTQICKQLISCPADYTICSKQGWGLSADQERQLRVSDIVSSSDTISIRTKHDQPKCGVRDYQGSVVGFVHTQYNTKLKALRHLISSQIIQGNNFSEVFQFVDENSWPISSVQEKNMTVLEILIGYCVSTTIQPDMKSPSFSPPRGPPLKKFKGGPELSFRSGKDISRQHNSDSPSTKTSAKQVLISYVRSEAADHALQLKEQLTVLGCSVYLDVHEIQTGVDWQDSLNFAVSECEVFVPLVTQKYGQTQWTNREVKLADVLGKYILPVSFLPDWPPRCLAIQFATTQYIPWVPVEKLQEISEQGLQESEQRLQQSSSKPDWLLPDIKLVAEQVYNRILGLKLSKVPSLMKRATVVKSCPCVIEDNASAVATDREGKPLVMICVHPLQQIYGEELRSVLEVQGLEVWCTTQLERSHMEHIDSLQSSQEDVTYSILNKGIPAEISDRHDNENLKSIRMFQEKADDSSVVLFILSEMFASSRVCQQQVFYCEHRKRVIPVLYEDFKMPDWLTMLIGSHGLERKNDEDFQDVLLQRIRAALDPTYRMRRMSTSSFSPGPVTMSNSSSPNSSNPSPRFLSGSNLLQNISPHQLLQKSNSAGSSRSLNSSQSEGFHNDKYGPVACRNGRETTGFMESDSITSPTRQGRRQSREEESHTDHRPSLTSAKTLIL